MKKTLLIILTIMIIILAIILANYYKYKEIENTKKGFNTNYEAYLDKEIYGTEIATIINKAVDDNEKSSDDEEKKVKIEVKIIDFKEEKIYNMDMLYNGGMNQFVQYYNSIKFKCTDIKYNNERKSKLYVI